MKKALKLMTTLGLAFSLVACSQPAANNTTQPASEPAKTEAAAEPAKEEAKTGVFKIGAIHDLTGAGSVLGIASKNGHEIAVKEINDAGGVKIGDTTYTIELIAYDCKSDPNEGISAYQKLAQVDKASIIMGPSLSNVGLASADTAEELKVPYLGQFGDPRVMLGEDYNTLKNYMFLMQPSASQSGVYSVSYVVEKLGAKKVGFLIAQDHAYCSTQANAALKYCEANGIETVVEYNNQADLDMKTQLTALQAAGVDALFNANPTQPLTVSTNQKYQLGFNVPQTGSLDHSSPFASLCADTQTASNIYFMSNTDYGDEEFVELNEKCKAQFNEEATIKTALGYDQILIAVAAAQKAGSTDPQAIHDALENISGVDTVITDNFCMNPETHMPLGLEVCIMKIDNAEYSMVEWWSTDTAPYEKG